MKCRIIYSVKETTPQRNLHVFFWCCLRCIVSLVLHESGLYVHPRFIKKNLQFPSQPMGQSTVSIPYNSALVCRCKCFNISLSFKSKTFITFKAFFVSLSLAGGIINEWRSHFLRELWLLIRNLLLLLAIDSGVKINDFLNVRRRSCTRYTFTMRSEEILEHFDDISSEFGLLTSPDL